jgi:hypothetical protein
MGGLLEAPSHCGRQTSLVQTNILRKYFEIQRYFSCWEKGLIPSPRIHLLLEMAIVTDPLSLVNLYNRILVSPIINNKEQDKRL